MNKKIPKFKNEEAELWQKVENIEKKFDKKFKEIFSLLKQISNRKNK